MKLLSNANIHSNRGFIKPCKFTIIIIVVIVIIIIIIVRVEIFREKGAGFWQKSGLRIEFHAQERVAKNDRFSAERGSVQNLGRGTVIIVVIVIIIVIVIIVVAAKAILQEKR